MLLKTENADSNISKAVICKNNLFVMAGFPNTPNSDHLVLVPFADIS